MSRSLAKFWRSYVDPDWFLSIVCVGKASDVSFIYLNDVAAGGTHFKAPDLEIRPLKGVAVLAFCGKRARVGQQCQQMTILARTQARMLQTQIS